MTPIVLTLEFSKSTKNTHVYVCTDSAVPSLYIQKSALPTPAPKVKLTLEPA